ncbi:MAG: GNAT superfamily N-acetyltransferase [Candidatus Azotimanducaceae bacterium]|jgi:GNAT superfamily N-acetyltransferase
MCQVSYQPLLTIFTGVVLVSREKFMHIDSANLNNLTQLWQSYGARSLYEDDQFQLRANISWPNRVWVEMSRPMSDRRLEHIAENTPAAAILPLWPAMTEGGSAAPQVTVDALVRESSDWQLAVQHTAMALKLDKQRPIKTQATARYPMEIRRLNGDVDLASWVATGSRAFGYNIDVDVIAPLLGCEHAQILLGFDEGSQPVATGLLFKTGDVVGTHQIGVPADHQGKGYATQMMRFLIQCAEQWQASYVVLQASAAGRPVYQKLGFVDQFLIAYLQRIER